MYIEGIISKVQGYTAKLKLPQYDNTETEWLVIPQLFSVKNKSGYKPEIGTLAAAILNDDMTDGCILGAIYNDEDAVPENSENTEFIHFADGVKISHLQGSGELEFFASKIKFNADIECSSNITAALNVSDGKSSMENMRTIYNSHTNPNGGIVSEKM